MKTTKSLNTTHFRIFFALLCLIAILLFALLNMKAMTSSASVSTTAPALEIFRSPPPQLSKEFGDPTNYSLEAEAVKAYASDLEREKAAQLAAEQAAAQRKISQSTAGTASGQITPDPTNYFSDALFIGDSRMQGFMLYSGVQATGYTATGLNVDTVQTKVIAKTKNGKVTAIQGMQQHQFGKVYIMLGMNELGWVREDIFIQKYGQLIDQVKVLQPNAIIYIESILPVTQAKHQQGTIENNTRIAQYNELLKNLAAEKAVKFITPSEAVSDENGYLQADASTDGVHLNKKYCQIWLSYLNEHR